MLIRQRLERNLKDLRGTFEDQWRDLSLSSVSPNLVKKIFLLKNYLKLTSRLILYNPASFKQGFQGDTGSQKYLRWTSLKTGSHIKCNNESLKTSRETWGTADVDNYFEATSKKAAKELLVRDQIEPDKPECS